MSGPLTRTPEAASPPGTVHISELIRCELRTPGYMGYACMGGNTGLLCTDQQRTFKIKGKTPHHIENTWLEVQHVRADRVTSTRHNRALERKIREGVKKRSRLLC